MRVLILSANTGGGHNSAAKAIGESLARRNIEYEMRDCLSFISEAASQVISRGHNCLYRYLPKLFGWGYRFEENHSGRILYESMAPGAKSLRAYLEKNRFDVIVSTHTFAALMLTEVRRKYGLSIPDYLVCTDYTHYPGMDLVDSQVFFVPHEELIPTYIEAGFAAERLVVSGIPISPVFSEPMEQQEARRRLGLPLTGQTVLLCCGSMGCGSIHRIAPLFLQRLPADATLVIICGHNVRAYEQLSEIEDKRLVVVGYTQRIAEYMAASDVCVSKPGGLTTTEMLAVGVPMVLVLAVPGCESHNLRFFDRLQVAVSCEEWEQAILATAELLGSSERLQDMRRRMAGKGYGNGAEVIASYICSKNNQK